MDWRSVLRLAAILLAAGSLAGCSDAITVHPMARYLDASPEVPPLAGKWIVRNGDGDAALLEVDGRETDQGRCRVATIHYREGDEDTVLGNAVCFFELNGHLLAELTIGEPYEVYRQYLVKVSTERIEACGMSPVWVMLLALAEDRPVGYSLEALQYTERGQNEGKLLVFISQPKEMRQFLELALPELASACDSGGEEFDWFAFERMSPEEQREEETAAEEE
ncbi:MAG TPA: hypothetical protein VFI92_15735 [Steroidobacteraceae bacterium]|nr:hypothetical protein [Steroidobacteraceae bacterium]